MYILNKSLAILGVVVAALSTIFCPFIKVPLVGKWNMYETDTSLFFLTLGFIGLCVLFFFLRSVRWYRFSAIAFFVWCVLAFSAVYFKINNFFGLKLVDNLLGKTLHIQWGWAVLFLGALIMLFSVKKVKSLS